MKLNIFLFPFLSGVLLSVPWLFNGFGQVLFFALVPLFYAESFFYENRKKGNFHLLIMCGVVTFFSWNILACWWSYKPTWLALISVSFINGSLMTLFFSLSHYIRCKYGSVSALFSSLFLWLAFEYLHFNWDLSFPWLTLGIGFASTPDYVQWYEYTGVSGGSFLVLISNFLIFYFSKNIKKRIGIVFLWASVVGGLLFLSYKIKREQKYISDKNIRAAIMQPDINPYTEKGNRKIVLNKILKNIDEINSREKKLDLVVAPETVAPWLVNEDSLNSCSEANFYNKLSERNNTLAFVIGANTFSRFCKGEHEEYLLRRRENGDSVVFSNSALFFCGKKTEVYNKSILFPAGEKAPFASYFSFFNKFIVDIGEFGGGLSAQDEAEVFCMNDDLRLAPIICWESLFGEYVCDFVNKGANIIGIITNDSWWAADQAAMMHCNIARLRAIECRRFVVRSANSGFSCFIDAYGDIIDRTSYNESVVDFGEIGVINKKTFYCKHGDYIGKFSSYVSVLILLFIFFDAKFKILSEAVRKIVRRTF